MTIPSVVHCAVGLHEVAGRWSKSGQVACKSQLWVTNQLRVETNETFHFVLYRLDEVLYFLKTFICQVGRNPVPTFRQVHAQGILIGNLHTVSL